MKTITTITLTLTFTQEEAEILERHFSAEALNMRPRDGQIKLRRLLWDLANGLGAKIGTFEEEKE